MNRVILEIYDRIAEVMQTAVNPTNWLTPLHQRPSHFESSPGENLLQQPGKVGVSKGCHVKGPSSERERRDRVRWHLTQKSRQTECSERRLS
jgi:hypothetical protein